MGKTRRFIDKKAAAHYQLVHRSQQDAAHEGSEAPSQFVLIPGPSSRQPRPLDGDGIDGTQGGQRGKISPNGDGSHITPLGMPNDGYDYERHMKIMGGGTFVTPQGRVTSVSVPAGGGGGGAAALPAEAMPSEELLERQLESITISEEVMDEDIRAAISGTATAPVEELDDDFVLQAAAADDTEEGAVANSTFDFDAHIARLIAASERKVGLNRPCENPSGESSTSAGDGAVAADGEDDFEGEYSVDGEASTGGCHDGPNNAGLEDGVEELFQRALEEYGSDEWGGLDSEDEQLQGQRDLQMDGWANRCFDDFLEENKSLSWTVDDAALAAAADKRKKTFAAAATAAVPAAEKGVAAAASRMAALAGAGRQITAAADGGATAAASGADKNGDVANMEADGPEEPVEEEGDDDVAALAQSFAYLGRAPQEKWDCESIVSTYSTLDNHPTTLSLGGEKVRRRRRGGDPAGSSSGSVGQAAAAAATGPRPVPMGFTPAVATSAAAAAEGQGVDGRGDGDGSDSDDIAGDNGHGGGAVARVASTRTRGEGAEERRARKLLVKGEKRKARERKRESRKLFVDGAAAAARVAANAETAHRRSVFAYS